MRWGMAGYVLPPACTLIARAVEGSVRHKGDGESAWDGSREYVVVHFRTASGQKAGFDLRASYSIGGRLFFECLVDGDVERRLHLDDLHVQFDVVHSECVRSAGTADAAFLTVYQPDAYAWPDSDTLQRAAQALILALHYTVVVPIFLFCFFTAVRWLRLQQPGLDLAHHPPYSIDGPRPASVGVPSSGNSDRGGSSSNTSAEQNEFEHHLNEIRVASLYPPHKLPQFARPPLAKPLTHLNLHRHASETKRNESRVLSHAVVNVIFCYFLIADAYALGLRRIRSVLPPSPHPRRAPPKGYDVKLQNPTVDRTPLNCRPLASITGARLPLRYRIQRRSTKPPPTTDDRSLPYRGARPPPGFPSWRTPCLPFPCAHAYVSETRTLTPPASIRPAPPALRQGSPTISKDADPLDFWRIDTSYTYIKQIVAKFLGPPPSSVESERTFSQLSQKYSAKRTSLSADHAMQHGRTQQIGAVSSYSSTLRTRTAANSTKTNSTQVV
ncbi:hypothetical protein niasHT_002270 [Heterodera trifolii]|uniref:HAT C-terminal dimerisation domain-containing protein n=1 Tax=Heterodera trifolii TaxID=157864 RepID=A0ABD2LNC4_9BILA